MALYEKTASELSELLGKKEISAVELAKDVFARTKAVEDKVQGYVTVAEEAALQQAEAVDKKRAAGEELSALAGIPIAIKDNICSSFKPKKTANELPYYTYDEALERYKLALVNAIVKHGKTSEKAYICLKTGWLFRGMQEELSTDDPDYESKKLEYEQTENQFLHNAYDGLIKARENETFPIAGMDMFTLDYLLANLAIRFGEYETGAKLVANLLAAKGTPSRIKDKARDLKAVIIKKLREQKVHE